MCRALEDVGPDFGRSGSQPAPAPPAGTPAGGAPGPDRRACGRRRPRENACDYCHVAPPSILIPSPSAVQITHKESQEEALEISAWYLGLKTLAKFYSQVRRSRWLEGYFRGERNKKGLNSAAHMSASTAANNKNIRRGRLKQFFHLTTFAGVAL